VDENPILLMAREVEDSMGVKFRGALRRGDLEGAAGFGLVRYLAYTARQPPRSSLPENPFLNTG
jgi:hypothetical protein